MAEAASSSRLAWRAGWLLGSVAFLLLIALAVVYVLRGATTRPTAALSSDEQAALDASRTEVADLTTFRRAAFDADWQRALDGMTGALRSRQAPKKAATLASLTADKIDSRGQVVSAGVESSTRGQVRVLVDLDVYQVGPDGKSTLSSTGRLVVTETQLGGTWLMSDLGTV